MLGTTLVTLALSLAVGSTTVGPNSHYARRTTTNGRFLPPGPGNGWGFANGNPDGVGWADYSSVIPVGPDRVPEYFFPRYFAYPANQLFSPEFYNPYITRGQRYIAFSNCGGEHPMGGLPIQSAALPTHPYQDTIGTGPRVKVPVYTGKVAATPINPGSTGLTP